MEVVCRQRKRVNTGGKGIINDLNMVQGRPKVWIALAKLFLAVMLKKDSVLWVFCCVPHGRQWLTIEAKKLL